MKNIWKTVPLGKVITLEYGKPLADDKRKKNGKYPVYGANGIKAMSDEFYCNKRTLIIGRKGSAGEINYTEEKFWPLDVTYFISFDEKEMDLQYLYYLLKGLDLPHLARGVKPGINRNDVYDIIVTIPSFEEQKLIVAKINKLFEVTNQARYNLNKQLKNIDELEKSILNTELYEQTDKYEIK